VCAVLVTITARLTFRPSADNEIVLGWGNPLARAQPADVLHQCPKSHNRGKTGLTNRRFLYFFDASPIASGIYGWMITNLQLLRGLAALGVVVYHTNIRINGVHSDLMGVSIFFVISGFIMVHITRDNADDFLAKRLIRIVPLYWILTIASLLWFGLGFANPPYVYPL
jgi:hypothetical protein